MLVGDRNSAADALEIIASAGAAGVDFIDRCLPARRVAPYEALRIR